MSATSHQKLIRQAMQLHQQGNLQQARDIYTQVLESEPSHPDALHLYGLACHQQGEHSKAITYIQRAIEQVPGEAVLRNNLGNALQKAGRFEEALLQLQTALELRPGYAGAHQNLGSVHLQMGNHDAAMEHASKAVKLDAGHPEAWYDLGLVQLDHILLSDAAESFRRALALRPVYPAAATSLLYILNLLPDADPGAVAKEHRSVATAAYGRVSTGPVSEDNNKRIRIGYVSGDFRAHAVNHFFEPVLEHHDQARFDIYCYSDVAHPDRVTRRLQQHSKHWRDISTWDNDKLFEELRSDRIDILVDLAGHTRHQRLAVFARKPAPVQLSWLGYPNTTGVDSIDYRVVDDYTNPGHHGGSEKLLCLPQGFACFRPPATTPTITSAPVITNGTVTLGCPHKLEKLNGRVLDLWSRILKENPNTRLLLARDTLDEWHQQRLLSLFANNGIEGERLTFIQLTDPGQRLFELFADIDIMLDVFPWSGHTLACCALWMGVPVVTLRGTDHAGRMVASVLKSMELDEFIAENTSDYACKVNELCEDIQRLSHYRSELRTRFERSPLRDETGFTRQLEAEYCRILNL